jgi:flavin-dependent dehydrogenase
MYDLIVVGGGPSGPAACRRAAQLGLNTLLIEKEFYQFSEKNHCSTAINWLST